MTDIDTLAARIRAELDAEEAVAQAATWADEAARWHVWRGKESYERPFVIIDSLDDGVTAVSAESSDTESVAEHIARQDPATVLARVARDRRLLDLLLAEEHGFGWTEQCYGEPCLCGRDERVAAYLAVLAEGYEERP
ncbi:DUF6221 family protein [Streptacidiphilus cavernicola]|uniref:DUF6221 family protein n=1 Tax=Streptacidiphilus cavernicola TaxID=3342716 RepID=A0ABV6VXQ2_9ACTN